MTPLIKFYLEHPTLTEGLLVTWLIWVAIALLIICIELHSHNTREERRDFRQRLEDDRRTRNL